MRACVRASLRACVVLRLDFVATPSNLIPYHATLICTSKSSINDKVLCPSLLPIKLRSLQSFFKICFRNIITMKEIRPCVESNEKIDKN